MITPMAIEIPTAADSHATRFSKAITRHPAASAVNGLRTQNTGAVDINLMAKQHNDYQEALLSSFRPTVDNPPHRAPQDITHTPTTRHPRSSPEAYRSSLSTPEYQGAQRVL